MKKIVVYYSLEGNTEYAAGRIAKELGADVLSLKPEKAYHTTGFKKFFWGGKSAVMAETPALEPYAFDKDAYDLVVIGFPVWAGTITPPIRTFLKENDLAGKKVAAFACQSGNGGERALSKLRDVAGTESFEAEMILIDPKSRPSSENEEKINAFCETLSKEV